jgi:formylglycine-generating enzyme required for sulfatase activity
MFEYDVFLSYSHKDKSIVHALAESLKQDGLRVWLDKWEIRPGDLIPLKIQHGLEKSRILLMCMSPAYFDSEWGTMEHYTLLFRNPTNTQSRLIPLLIEDCNRPDIIAQFAYIDWRTFSDEAYNDILDSCQEKDSELFSTNLNSDVQPNIPKTFTSPSTNMEFVLIPAGKFMMGSHSDEQGRFDSEGPAHKVIIKIPFYMSKYKVSQKQWVKVMGINPSHFKSANYNRPVENVLWDNVQDFITKLNEKESTYKYRLPSESEWEYACRAGTTTRYSFGDDESKLGDYAWYDGNSGNQTHPVGLKKPNPWGLHDMHGNVWEWCQDKWHDNYDGAPCDGSAWESGSSSNRVCRGSNMSDFSRFCRSASRSVNEHDFRFFGIGFRVVWDL